MSATSILFDTIRFSTRKYIFENKDEGSYGSNLIGIFDNRIGIGTNAPSENYICTIEGDTLIKGNLTANTLNYVTSNLTYLEVNSLGGYPALDLIQTGSQPFIRMLSSSNEQTVVDVVQSDGNIGIGTNHAFEKLVVQGNIVASNLRLLGTYLEKRALQMKPVQQTFVVGLSLQSNFSVITEGIYDGSPESTSVYLDGYKLAYSNQGPTDYNMVNIIDYAGNSTEYVVSLTKQANYGSIVDITVFPYYLPSTEAGLQPGWAVQNITSTFFSKNPANDVYILHNVGIGEVYPSSKLHIKNGSATNSIVVKNDSGDTKFVVDSGGSVGIGTSTPRSTFDVVGGGKFSASLSVDQLLSGNEITAVSKLGVGTATTRQTMDVYGNAIISGNLGVGFSNPSHRLYIEGNAYISCNLGIGTKIPRQLVDIYGGNVVMSGAFGIGTTNPLQSFHVEGQSYFGGSIGMGTTTPRYSLDIAGSGIFSGNLGIGTTIPYISLYVAGDTFMGGTLGIGTTLPRSTVDILGTTLIQGNVGIGTTVLRQTVDIVGGSLISGNVGVGGILGVGTTVARASLDVLGNAVVSGNIGIGITTPLVPLHTVGTSVFMNGNLGIGTTLPRQLVDIVGGNIILSGNLGIGTTISLAALDIRGGTSTLAPLLVRSGTVLTSATAGTIEYDGTVFYGTTSVTHGRGYQQTSHIYRLAVDGSAISTIANVYGASSGITLAANRVYEVEYHVYFTKTTAGTVTFTLVFGGTSTSIQRITATYIGSPISGIALGTPQIASYLYTVGAGATSFPLPGTGTLTTGVNHYYTIKVLIENGASPGTFSLQAAASAGSITPLRGSYYKATVLPSTNTGIFA